MSPLTNSFLETFRDAPAAKKLFSVIVQQAYEGPIQFKASGVATPPEILEACGLDVSEFYSLLAWLTERGLIQVKGDYPFEEIRLTSTAQRVFRPAAGRNDFDHGGEPGSTP